MREQLDRVGASGDEVAGSVTALGFGGPVLRDVAERVRADVVVVGAAALAPLPLNRVGSTVRYLLHEGSRPVLVVRGEPRIPPARVLAPLDLSLFAADSLRCGLALLASPGGEPLPELIALTAVDEAGKEPADTREVLSRFLTEHAADYDGSMRLEVRPGDAVEQILAAAEKERPDLVLLGTHGRSGWERFRLGSVAEAVLRRATTSVLVVPPLAALGSAFAEAVDEAVRFSM
jgi:nucleotide-binding universal stress UspA family protein